MADPEVARLRVEVVPVALELVVGQRGHFEAVVTNRGGSEAQTRVEWSSSDLSVASIAGDGTVTGNSRGKATITASVSGSYATAEVSVFPPPWQEQTWEKYSGTEDFRSNAKSDGLTELLGLDRIFLDFSSPVPGLTRSLRYDWVNQGARSISIGVGVPFPSEVTEAWTEVQLRYSRNYRVCHPESLPCDHKLLFLQITPDLNGRWETKNGGMGEHSNPGISFGWEGVGGDIRATTQKLTPLVDEEWYTYRMYTKQPSGRGAADGAVKVWIDGVLVGEGYNFAINQQTQANTWVQAILVGRNKDKGQDSGTESLWVGRIRVWNSDPGW